MRKFVVVPTILAGFIMLFTPIPASSAPTASVCETGFRGQPDYDRLCLIKGTIGDAAQVWYGGRTERQRDDVCRLANRLHSLSKAVHETYGDTIGDTYRNSRQVERWTVTIGHTDCTSA